MPINVNTDVNNNVNINVDATQSQANVDIHTDPIIIESIGTTPLFGPTGNGISSISKTSTSGVVDTYTIYFTNGNTTTFNVTNGSSIASIEKTGTSGLVDTYTITLTNGDTSTFTVANGADGVSPTAEVTPTASGATITITDVNGTTTADVINGTDGEDGQDGYSPTATVSKSGDTATITITDKDGTTTASVTNGTDGTSATITGATASVTNTVGTPSVTVTAGGTESARTFDFAFSNLKGEKGDTGATGGVSSVNGQTGDVTLNASDVGALPNDTAIPDENTVSGWGFTKNAGTVTSVNNTSPDSSGNVSISIPSDYVTLNTLQTLTSGKKIFATDAVMAGNQTALLATISNNSTYTTDNAWVGRYICGAKNLTFLMGTYRTMAGIGAHSWTNAQTGTGASWADFYLNPDGGASVYIGGNLWTKNSGWLKVKNNGNTNGTVQVNRGSISSTSWKDVACWGDNISKFVNDAGYTTNVGTVTSVNNESPDANGNVSLTIPTVNNATLTITQGGTTKGTFSANASSDVTIDLDAGGGGGSVDIDNLSITENLSNEIQTVGVIDSQSGNAIKTWTGTKAQYDAIVTKDANTIYNITDDTDVTLTLLNLLYPVGAIYIGTMSTCPLAVLGIGTWVLKASDRVLQGAGTRGSVGTTLNESLPNIEGILYSGTTTRGCFNNASGAFSLMEDTGSVNTPSFTSGSGFVRRAKFNASGSNSTYQDSAPVQQDAYLVNIWERIS